MWMTSSKGSSERLITRRRPKHGLGIGRHQEPAQPRHELYNIGNHRPVELQHFIEVLERALGKKAEKKLMPLQPGDVPATYADIDDLTRDVGFKPTTSIEEGIPRFVKWYREFYKV